MSDVVPAASAGGQSGRRGLSLAPMRALRPAVDAERLGRLLSPPYDVIDADLRREMLAADPDNAVAVVLPDPTPAGYAQAAQTLSRWLDEGTYAVDDEPALFVYEMRGPDGLATRGLLGAVELRQPTDGVILPHENTMAGPVADRLDVMTATGTDLEPIYLVYDGGGAASTLVKGADTEAPVADATAPDGTRHRLWAVTDPQAHATVARDLDSRHALIADGHHRYATYLERQRRLRAERGPGPWDRGMALLVDSSEYGPQVHAIHRVIPGLPLDDALAALEGVATVRPAPADGAAADAVERVVDAALDEIDGAPGLALVLSDGLRAVVVTDPDRRIAAAARRPGEDPALLDLDVTLVHRGLVESVWSLPDTEAAVGYAHSVSEALTEARGAGGTALLLRPTPVAAVTAVAAAGARMPRKSTLFTPKPASGLVMRRLADQPDVNAH